MPDLGGWLGWMQWGPGGNSALSVVRLVAVVGSTVLLTVGSKQGCGFPTHV